MKKGLAFCPRCCEPIVQPVALAADKKYRCPNCGAVHYGLPTKVGRARACQRCECLYNKDTWLLEESEDWERMPSRDLCPDCVRAREIMAKIVALGGIYWCCNKCGNSGVFMADHPLAIQARKQAKRPAPRPLGAELNETNCPVCTGQAEGKSIDLLDEGSES